MGPIISAIAGGAASGRNLSGDLTATVSKDYLDRSYNLAKSLRNNNTSGIYSSVPEVQASLTNLRLINERTHVVGIEMLNGKVVVNTEKEFPYYTFPAKKGPLGPLGIGKPEHETKDVILTKESIPILIRKAIEYAQKAVEDNGVVSDEYTTLTSKTVIKMTERIRELLKASGLDIDLSADIKKELKIELRPYKEEESISNPEIKG